MAKCYIVDLRSLKPAERAEAVRRLDSSAFLATEVYEGHQLVAAQVTWNSSEDFLKSSLLPAGCPVQEVK